MKSRFSNETRIREDLVRRITTLDGYLQDLTADGKILTVGYKGKPAFRVNFSTPDTAETSPGGIIKNRIAKIAGPVAVHRMVVAQNTLTNIVAPVPAMIFKDFENPDSELVGDPLNPEDFTKLSLVIEAARDGEIPSYVDNR